MWKPSLKAQMSIGPRRDNNLASMCPSSDIIASMFFLSTNEHKADQADRTSAAPCTFDPVFLPGGKNTAQLAIFASVLVLLLVLAVGAVVYCKKFYKRE